MVSVCCITYNHAKYIRDAIEGFLNQKTTFLFEILIHDDASTDNTAQIIREYELQYPQLIFPIYQKENQFSKGNSNNTLKFNVPRARGKYIALCEGDDYWTDPNKLQKQVNFLETNPDYSLCCGGFETLNMITNERDIIINKKTNGDPIGFTFGLDEMREDWLTQPLTCVLKKEVLIECQTIKYKHCRCDHYFYHAIKKGKGFYFKQVFGVYRKHPGGICSMVPGNVNRNNEYNVAKELYEYNGDDFTRYFYLEVYNRSSKL